MSAATSLPAAELPPGAGPLLEVRHLPELPAGQKRDRRGASGDSCASLARRLRGFFADVLLDAMMAHQQQGQQQKPSGATAGQDQQDGCTPVDHPEQRALRVGVSPPEALRGAAAALVGEVTVTTGKKYTLMKDGGKSSVITALPSATVPFGSAAAAMAALHWADRRPFDGHPIKVRIARPEPRSGGAVGPAQGKASGRAAAVSSATVSSATVSSPPPVSAVVAHAVGARKPAAMAFAPRRPLKRARE